MTALRVSFLLLVVVVVSGCESADNADPPNIVFFLIDDMGWTDLGFQGSTYYETPRIDALAASGMVFTSAYSNAPNCAPTRAALMSGQYAPRHGVYTVASAARGESRYRQVIPTENTTELDLGIVTIAEALRAGGYTTAHFGKWHLGFEEYGPDHQGFDVVDLGHWARPNRHFMPETGQYLADYLTDQAVSFIEQDHEEPFFLYFPHYGVHTPIRATEEGIARFADKEGDEHHNDPTYAAMVASIDESVGRVIDALEARGMRENTLIIFFTDNGGYGPITSSYPLRGAKGMLYEGGIRVPMIASWPAQIEAGAANDTPVISTDFYPTFLELSGTATPEDHTLDGTSLASLFTGAEALDRDAIYWHFPAYLEAYYNQRVPWRTTPAGAIRVGDYKLIEYFGEQRLELYNLAEDISESTDLSADQPERVTEMHAMLQAWRMSVDAPVPSTPNPEFDVEAYAIALTLDDED